MSWNYALYDSQLNWAAHISCGRPRVQADLACLTELEGEKKQIKISLRETKLQEVWV